MQIVSIAWNVKSCFLGNKKKNNEFVVCWIYSPDNSVRYPRAPSVVSLRKALYPRILVLVSTQLATQEDSA